MKLNNENFDQSNFTAQRIMLSLLWLRVKRFTPDALRVSYRDMIIVLIEHYCPELKSIIRKLVHKVPLKRFKKGL